PPQTNTFNLAKVLPGSLETAAFATGIRPVIRVSSKPLVFGTTYPSGTILYHTGENRLYRVNTSATDWLPAINGTADIVADSITAGVIATSAIKANHMAADELIIGGANAGLNQQKLARFRVDDTF